MPVTRYRKLVRDRIPEIITAAGAQPVTRTLEGEEYNAALRAKLVEEAQEAEQAETAGDLARELADVLEVVRALAATAGLDMTRIEEVRAARAAERGAFTHRIWLSETHGEE